MKDRTGCLAIGILALIIAFYAAWIGFIVWAGITLVNWITSK